MFSRFLLQLSLWTLLANFAINPGYWLSEIGNREELVLIIHEKFALNNWHERIVQKSKTVPAAGISSSQSGTIFFKEFQSRIITDKKGHKQLSIHTFNLGANAMQLDNAVLQNADVMNDLIACLKGGYEVDIAGDKDSDNPDLEIKTNRSCVDIAQKSKTEIAISLKVDLLYRQKDYLRDSFYYKHLQGEGHFVINLTGYLDNSHCSIVPTFVERRNKQKQQIQKEFPRIRLYGLPASCTFSYQEGLTNAAMLKSKPITWSTSYFSIQNAHTGEWSSHLDNADISNGALLDVHFYQK